jgi:branched-chain amino acid transport system substrate-binding protein
MASHVNKIATGLLLALSLASGPAMADPQKYTIGCALPLSGRMVGFGEPIKAGIEVAIESFNEKNGDKIKFDLQCNDSKGDPKETINIAQRLIDNSSVIASISDFTSTATMAAAETYKKGEMVQITPSASHPDLTKMNPWMFRASLTTPVYIRPTADLIIDKLKLKRVAVVQVQTDWGQSVAKVFNERMKERGGEVVMHEVYNEGQTDFRSILTQIRRLNPDVIFLAMLEEETANFVKQKHQFGMKQPIVDSSVGITPRSIKLGGPAMEGIYAMTMFNEASKDPLSVDFAKRYRAKAGDKTPDIWSAYGYDAGTLIMQAAMRAMPKVTRSAVRDELAKTKDYHGANGQMSIDPETREVLRDNVTFTQVKDGLQVPIN